MYELWWWWRWQQQLAAPLLFCLCHVHFRSYKELKAKRKIIIWQTKQNKTKKKWSDFVYAKLFLKGAKDCHLIARPRRRSATARWQSKAFFETWKGLAIDKRNEERDFDASLHLFFIETLFIIIIILQFQRRRRRRRRRRRSITCWSVKSVYRPP